MDLDLKDRVIVVTGGGSGIGEAITRACLAEGARVVVVGRVTERVRAFEQELIADGARCRFLEVELGDVEACKEAVQTIEDEFGRLDGLVNNAGANDSIGLAEGEPAAFFESLRHNLLHYYAMAHYCLPLLKRGKGAIVNISSKVALTGQGGTSAYAAAKGAQLALTREWAAELAEFGVRGEQCGAGRGADAVVWAVASAAGCARRCAGADRRPCAAGASHDTGGGDCFDRGVSFVADTVRAHDGAASCGRWWVYASGPGTYFVAAPRP